MIVQLDLHESKSKECTIFIERLDNRRKKASEDSQDTIDEEEEEENG